MTEPTPEARAAAKAAQDRRIAQTAADLIEEFLNGEAMLALVPIAGSNDLRTGFTVRVTRPARRQPRPKPDTDGGETV